MHDRQMISACGDNCALCPRYTARTRSELEELAHLWIKLGWRDPSVDADRMRCSGCGSQPGCTYGLLECCSSHGISRCTQCSSFPCEKVAAMLKSSQLNRRHCAEVCSEEELTVLDRAFYHKEEYLGLLPEGGCLEDLN